MPKGGIWLGLSSKDLLNLQLKTELYAGLWLEVESFKQYCIEFFLRRTYRGGSFASIQRLDDGEVRQAPKHRRRVCHSTLLARQAEQLQWW